MNTLGQRIREVRLKKGITQIDLSQGLCTPSMISQIESDRARPSYKILFGIADRLDVPLEKLLVEVDLNLEHTSKYKMAMAMVKAKKYITAIPLLEQLLELTSAPVSEVDVRFELGICHLETGHAEQAMKFFNQVLEGAAVQQDHLMIASVLLRLGQVSQRQKELPLALYHSQRALEEFAKSEEDDPTLHVRILLQLAAINQEMGKVVEAAQLYEESLTVYDECFSLQEKGNVYLNLAWAYHLRGDYEKADDYSTKASSVWSELGEQDKNGDWQRQLILLKRSKVEWKESVQELLRFAAMYETQSDSGRAGEIYADIASIYLENGELEEAWGFAEKAGLILPHDHMAMGAVHRVLAFVFFGKENQEKGRKHLNNAIAIFERHGQMSKLEEVTLHMCHHLSEQGNHQEAFERLERFHDTMMKKLNERGIVL